MHDFDDILCSHYEVNISSDKAELYEKNVYFELLVSVIIYFKGSPCTYCLIQGRYFICCNF